ncbi:phage protein NinX family protein [Paraburkholderia sp. J8-2]|uniref:phage protein NinX family protein n=1 Tax=Paraburkholderia sp. J8-2 TaxID=2805440 RepID=UPI002AB74DF1|nr:phage protein NinX family protein [Paraburkholderia sp. J8-2]
MNQQQNEQVKVPVKPMTNGDGNAIMVLVGERMGLAPGLVAEATRQLEGGNIHPMTGAAIEREAVALNDRLRVDATLIDQANAHVEDLKAQFGFAERKVADARAHTVSVEARDLAGVTLEWAVAKCEDLPVARDPMGFKSGSEAGYWIWDKAPKGIQTKIGRGYTPSTNPAQGWPIIDRERPHLCPILLNGAPAYEAWLDGKRESRYYGETALIAAMRCYVASKLGENVDVPADLVHEAGMDQARRSPSPGL